MLKMPNMETKISLKELFEEVIKLKAEFKNKNDKDEYNVRRFISYVYILMGLGVVSVITNILLHLIFYLQK